MFKDPFGGTDWDAVARFGFLVGIFFLFLTLGGAAEGNWYDPYNAILVFFQGHFTVTIGLTIIGLIVAYSYSKFSGGHY